MFLSILSALLIITIQKASSSAGDQSPYYQRCLERCSLLNCTEDGVFLLDNSQKPSYLQALEWECEDECRYECMWKTVDAFLERKWRTPQFYGKWPFVRFFGVQEPASALFSVLNLISHYAMIKKFRRNVPPDSPLYWLWHIMSFVSLNAWIWSTIFHTRDYPLSELMDYAGAFSMVLLSCYCMTMRLLCNAPRFVLVTITTFFVAFLANHVAYLSMGTFDYGYNMQLNIIIGTFTAISWFGWSCYNRNRQPYVWKCAVFVALAGLSMLLEIIDMPPLWWILDCHALWHLTTAPLTCLFYSFIVDDCNFLRQQQLLNSKDKKRN